MAEDKNGEPNYLKAAFHWQYNVIGLAAAAGFALISASALPLLLGAGVELIYLSMVPQNGQFKRLVRSWRYAEDKRDREQTLSAMFYELPPEMRVRFANLDAICKAIRQNYSRLSSTSQMFVDQMESKLRNISVNSLISLHKM